MAFPTSGFSVSNPPPQPFASGLGRTALTTPVTSAFQARPTAPVTGFATGIGTGLQTLGGGGFAMPATQPTTAFAALTPGAGGGTAFGAFGSPAAASSPFSAFSATGRAAAAAPVGGFALGGATPGFGVQPAYMQSPSQFGTATTLGGGLGSGFGWGGAYGSGGGGGGGGGGFGGIGSAALGGMSATGWGQTPGLLFQQSTLKEQLITPNQALEAIRQAFDPASPFYRFRAVFWNLTEVPMSAQGTPLPIVHNVPAELLRQAAPPDPTLLPPRYAFVPVVASGFRELKARVEAQDRVGGEQARAVEELSRFVQQLEQRHDVAVRSRIEEARRRQLELQARVLRVLHRVELMQARGVGVSATEEAWRARVAALAAELAKPTQFHGRLQELTALAKLQLEDADMSIGAGGSGGSGGGGGGGSGAAGLDSESQERVGRFLAEQQTGLGVLCDVVRSDERDLNILLTARPSAPSGNA